MSTAGILEFVAWLCSAVIAAWLVLDLVRVSRRYDEATLINPGEAFPDMDTDAPADHQRPRRSRS